MTSSGVPIKVTPSGAITVPEKAGAQQLGKKPSPPAVKPAAPKIAPAAKKGTAAPKLKAPSATTPKKLPVVNGTVKNSVAAPKK